MEHDQRLRWFAREVLPHEPDVRKWLTVRLRGLESCDVDEVVQEAYARMWGADLDKVGNALASLPGPVLISGHTDSIPIRTARFPSNWHLSRDRAEAVKTYLSNTVSPRRMQAEGRADTETVASNETPEGRADNRRVEINLFVAK